MFFYRKKYFGSSPYLMLLCFSGLLFPWTSFSLLLSSIFFLFSSSSLCSISRPCSSATTTVLFSFANWLRMLKSRSSRAFSLCNFSLFFSLFLHWLPAFLVSFYSLCSQGNFPFFSPDCFFVTSGEFSFFSPPVFFFSLQGSYPSFFHLVAFLKLCPWYFSSLPTVFVFCFIGKKNQVTSSQLTFMIHERRSFHMN